MAPWSQANVYKVLTGGCGCAWDWDHVADRHVVEPIIMAWGAVMGEGGLKSKGRIRMLGYLQTWQ